MDYTSKEDWVEYFFEKIKYSIIPSESNNYKSRFLQSNFLLYVVVLLFVLRIGATLISTNIPSNIFFADITKSVLENLVNQTRQSAGLLPLTENQQLDAAAQMKAENMLQNNYFDHTSPAGITPWYWFLKAGYDYHYAGENLAIGFFDSQEVYNAWLNSPTHKANIVNSHYTEVGTAVLSGYGGGNTIIVVQEFGSEQPVKAVVTSKNNSKAIAVQPAPVTKTPAVLKTNNQNLTTNTRQVAANGEKVLSQTTEVQNSLEPLKTTVVNNLPSKVLNTVLYNYDALLQNITYGVSLIVIGIMLTLIFFNFNISFKKPLVLRAVLVMSLLVITTMLNKDVLISLIPHQTLI